MKLWRKQPSGKVEEADAIDLSHKTVLIMQGREQKESAALAKIYMQATIPLFNDKQDVTIYTTSCDPEQDYSQETLNYNGSPSTYCNREVKQFVDKIVKPILADEAKINQLSNLTIIPYSYGTAVLLMIENCLKETMQELGYSKEKQKEIMGKVLVVCVSPVTTIEEKSVEFNKIFFAPTNDKVNALYNRQSPHLSSRLGQKPRYEKTGKHSLVVTCDVPVLRFDGAKLHYEPMAHRYKDIMVSSKTADGQAQLSDKANLFPILIKNALNNAVARNGEEIVLTDFLKPKKVPASVAGHEGYGFTEQVAHYMVDKFLKEGDCSKPNHRSH